MTGALASEHLKAEANRLIRYHAGISKAMTAERTSLESGLIPVSAYILVACCEAWHRYPDMVAAIETAAPAASLGRSGRRPGSQVNAVYLWSVPNFYLIGRKFLTMFQLVEDSAERTWKVLDFWERAALAFRGDGHRQAWDAGFTLRPYDEATIATLLAGVAPVGEGGGGRAALDRTKVKRFSATLVSYLFLLYFDTRVGTGDTGPYPLPDGRVLLVRDYYRLGASDFWWSDVAKAVPYNHLTAGLVLEGVGVEVNDWGTSITKPENYLDHLVGFSLFTTDTSDRALRPVPFEELDDIVAEVRAAQSQHYRNVAAMTRSEKIRCGAYVYFSFLRPFAEAAGLADELDWTVPRDTLGMVYDMLEPVEGTNTPPDPEDVYYAPLP
jgi:hypothetical protein